MASWPTASTTLLGWVASSNATGLTLPNAEDVYAHIGVKSGGVALDGEGKYGPNVPDPRKPWAEKSITIDLFAYHGIAAARQRDGDDAGAATPVQQDDSFNALGAVVHGQLDSLSIMLGDQLERHKQPYPGAGATTVGGMTVNGAPDLTSATSTVAYGGDRLRRLALVGAGRAGRVHAHDPRVVEQLVGSTAASLLRVIPGIAMLVRPNIKAVLTGDIERAYGLPPVGSWTPAGGFAVAPGAGQSSKFEAEQINATVAVAY